MPPRSLSWLLNPLGREDSAAWWVRTPWEHAQKVGIAEPLRSEVLGGLLPAYTVVALEDDGRLPIQTEQRIVISLIKQTRPVDLRECAFLVGADIDQFDRHTAIEQGLQLRSWQLANGRRLVRLGVLTHRWLILVRPVLLGQSVAAGGGGPRGRQTGE